MSNKRNMPPFEEMTEEDFQRAERALGEWFISQNIRPMQAISIMCNVIRWATYSVNETDEDEQRRLLKLAATWVAGDDE